ncbi:hypothetical protein [Microcoleus sp.]|uniref:hypothetical protein n=1 Tax=Microcoleus sp. TaxID=44472 RepID=UPI003523A706
MAIRPYARANGHSPLRTLQYHFKCAQYAHIAWWTMSFAGVKSAYVMRFSPWRSESGQLLITH